MNDADKKRCEEIRGRWPTPYQEDPRSPIAQANTDIPFLLSLVERLDDQKNWSKGNPIVNAVKKIENLQKENDGLKRKWAIHESNDDPDSECCAYCDMEEQVKKLQQENEAILKDKEQWAKVVKESNESYRQRAVKLQQENERLRAGQ